jgi:hypothetical protein
MLYSEKVAHLQDEPDHLIYKESCYFLVAKKKKIIQIRQIMRGMDVNTLGEQIGSDLRMAV